MDPGWLFVGSLITQSVRRVVGATAQEAAVAGKIADAVIGATIGFKGDIIPQSVKNTMGVALTALQAWGAWQTASLALLSVGSAPVALPLGLAGLAGIEVGLLFNDIYERISGQALGADIYDWLHPPRKDGPC